jgi:hypothetical protein
MSEEKTMKVALSDTSGISEALNKLVDEPVAVWWAAGLSMDRSTFTDDATASVTALLERSPSGDRYRVESWPDYVFFQASDVITIVGSEGRRDGAVAEIRIGGETWHQKTAEV